MLWLLRSVIRIYQCTLSPVLSLLCGPESGCRFTPTCSEYFLQAVEAHGVGLGTWLGLRRLGRCQPWGGSGYDPIPAAQDSASGSPATAGVQHLESGLTAGPGSAE